VKLIGLSANPKKRSREPAAPDIVEQLAVVSTCQAKKGGTYAIE